jgi:SAM-dependent methyltransferase
MNDIFKELFNIPVTLNGNLIIMKLSSEFEDQQQTNNIFSDKWLRHGIKSQLDGIELFQLRWYLDLYGFNNDNDFKDFLKTKKIILDAGCGLGYKAAWMALLSPESIVIGMDFSEAVFSVADHYKGISNLFFVKGDIAQTNLKEKSIDYISCDQVIHHTENPEKTFEHLSKILSRFGQIACYVYARKALPRELLDEYFRTFTKSCTNEELWEMSEQLTVLGKTLSELNIKIDVPDIPLLNIKGGIYDIQRFIYWNFLKCFWNDEFGWDNSVSTNFDWYGPVNASRYSEEEFKSWITKNNLNIVYFHKEEACYSGRFIKT